MKKYILAIFLCLLGACTLLQAQDTQKINKKNLVIKEWNSPAGSSKKVLDHQTIYNSDGKKIEEKEYGSYGLKWTKRYEYDASGKVSRELAYDERNKLVTIKKIEYNEFGRKKIQYTYDAKNRLVSTKTFEYLAEDSD